MSDRRENRGGCSRETADKLIDCIIRTNAFEIGLMLCKLPMGSRREESVDEIEEPVPSKAHRGSGSKILPEIKQYIRDNRGLSPKEIVDNVESIFGRKICVGSVYKVWKRELETWKQKNATQGLDPGEHQKKFSG